MKYRFGFVSNSSSTIFTLGKSRKDDYRSELLNSKLFATGLEIKKLYQSEYWWTYWTDCGCEECEKHNRYISNGGIEIFSDEKQNKICLKDDVEYDLDSFGYILNEGEIEDSDVEYSSKCLNIKTLYVEYLMNKEH